jgi:hypothetical protein
LALLLPEEEDVEGMEVTMIDIYISLYSGILKVTDIGERLIMEGLPVQNIGIAGR